MSSFSKDDMTFSFQALGANREEQYPGMSYLDFWGDQYEWTALLPAAWKLVSTNGRLRPNPNDHQSACCWWNVPLHLLGLGLGWTNIALGLQQWRELGYPADNPVLRFIKESYGPSIEGLEVFLVTRDWINEIYMESMKIHGFTQFEPAKNLPASEYRDLELRDDRTYLENAKRVHSFGPRWALVTNLLSGGDGCHLSRHFPDSADFDNTTVHEHRELDELRVLFMSEDRIGVEAPAYKGFCYRLIEAMGIHSQAFEKIPSVSLYIKSLGHVGEFQHSSETGRFFIASAEENTDYAHRSHLLGNIN